MMRIWTALLIGVLASTVRAGDDPKQVNDLSARVEYTLKTPRPRDPVLGGARDKVFVSVWIPAGVKTVRGAMCNPFSKGDAVGAHWQAVCRHWQFASVQTDFDAVKKEDYTLLAQGLTDLAKKTEHPELAHVPLCFTGMSRGGGMSMQLAEMMPERTIASVPVCLEVGPRSEATRRLPVLTLFGEKDGTQMKQLLAKLPTERALGARWSIAVQWGRGHEFARANNLSFVFLDDVISRRVPKQPASDRPVPLAALPLEEGWLGDQTSWAKDGKRPTIQTWQDFKGERSQVCWLPSQRTAAVWQAFVAGGKDITITEPAGLGDGKKFVLHSSKKPIAVTVALTPSLQPTKVELWNAHQLLAQRTAAPWTFDVTLPPGVHSLCALLHESGQTRSSKPNTIVVGD